MISQDERPQTFDEMLGQEFIVENIRQQSITDKWFSVYILEGQYGSGKTTMEKIIALAANCTHKDERGNPCLKCPSCQHILSGGLDFKEIDAAKNSGVDDIRALQEYVDYIPIQLKYKVIAIDEVHMLSKSAFNGMLKMLEEPPEYMIFILCTSESQAIPITVRSRSAPYKFCRLNESMITKGLLRAAPKHGIDLEPDAASLLANCSDGSMRNAYVLLEQVSVYRKKVDESVCMEVLGIVNEDTLFQVVRTIIDQDLPAFIHQLDEMEQGGKSFSLVAADLLKVCADLVVASLSGSQRVGGTSFYKQSIQELANTYTLNDFCVLADSLRDIRLRTQSGSKYEFLVYMINVFHDVKNGMEKVQIREDLQGLETRIAALENGAPQIQQLERVAEAAIPQKNTTYTDIDIDKPYPIPSGEGVNTWHSTSADEKVPFKEDIPRDDLFSDFDNLMDAMNQEKMRPYFTADSVHMEQPSEEGQLPNTQEISQGRQIIQNIVVEESSSQGSSFCGNDEGQETEAPQKDMEMQAGSANPVEIEEEAQVNTDQIRARFEDALSREPILSSRYNVSCRVEKTESGLKVMASEQSLCSQLLLFIGTNGIKGVSVEYDPGY